MSSKLVSKVNIDWRQPIACYLQNPGKKIEWEIQRSTFKFALVDDICHRQTYEGYCFIFVATDYFIKWISGPSQEYDSCELTEFIIEHIRTSIFLRL
jgi:hypothetical protein